MKKLALSAILGASLMVTSSAFALTSMSADNMKAATGQAGVSITLDNVVIEQFIGSTTYTDDDGFDGLDGGAIVISDKHVIKQYNALTSLTDFTTNFSATDARHYTAGIWQKAAALSIDVGNCNILMTGNNANKDATAAVTVPVTQDWDNDPATPDTTNNVPLRTIIGGIVTATAAATDPKAAAAALLVSRGIAKNISEANGYYEFATNSWNDLNVVGVVIGLPTLEIITSEDTYNVGVAQTDAINDGKNFINIRKGASRMAIVSGVVEIAAH